MIEFIHIIIHYLFAKLNLLLGSHPQTVIKTTSLPMQNNHQNTILNGDYMTPTEIRTKAPQGATHYDIENGQPVYFRVNNLGYTMKHDGNSWYSIKQGINNYRTL